MSAADRVVALDLGSRRIGVAVSSGALATPYEVVVRGNDRSGDHERIRALVAETGATLVVVGLPLSLDGSVGPAARLALEEAAELSRALDVPVETWDERLSTVEAERSLAPHLDGRARRRVIDQVAASVILQSWIDARQPPAARETS